MQLTGDGDAAWHAGWTYETSAPLWDAGRGRAAQARRAADKRALVASEALRATLATRRPGAPVTRPSSRHRPASPSAGHGAVWFSGGNPRMRGGEARMSWRTRTWRPGGHILAVALLLALFPATPAVAAPAFCDITALPFDELRVRGRGGAAIQEIVINSDCSVTKFPVKTLEPGTPEFDAFLAAKQSPGHRSGRFPLVDPTCWSELDYQDVAGLNLTTTRLGLNYSYNYAAGQVTAVYGQSWSTSAAIDGWYQIDQSLSPWTGPIPYGQVDEAGRASFAWVLGSFWHRHTNNNRADGFGTCSGWPYTEGSTVPGGRWAWAVWQ